MEKTILVTGGAGFIGSNFVHAALERYPRCRVINLDKLTYAGNLDNLRDLEGDPRHRFVHGDICDPAAVDPLIREADWVVNFAAETHVDRSILEAGAFIQTDIYGTFVLLEAVRRHGVERFLQISTDEVYGSVEQGSSREEDALMPRNPYSASKAGADRLAYSYFATYGLPVIITRASNNFGRYQYPEKLIPLFVTNALEDQPLPLYGDGLNVRDWLYAADHCAALCLVLERGELGEVYNIGGGNERTNREITRRILEILGKPESLVRQVADRQGHDRRYSLDCAKLRRLGWAPATPFEQALEATVAWYRDNEWWWRRLKGGAFAEYYRQQYVEREEQARRTSAPGSVTGEGGARR